MKRITSWLFITVTFPSVMVVTACSTFRHQTSNQGAKNEADCIPVYVSAAHGSPENGWATLLSRFQEMPLESLPACVDESYRVIWIPTFHSPVAVRVWSSSGSRYLVTKELDGKGGYGMGNLVLDQQPSLSDDQWFNFKRLLVQASYWDLPSADDAPIPHDGAEWVIEGFAGKKYHKVHRRSPSTEFRAACISLVQLSGLKTEIEEY
jgi:hypothetical protein